MTETEAPGESDAAAISRLSASGHDLCQRLTLKLVSTTVFMNTSNSTIATKIKQPPLDPTEPLGGPHRPSPDRYDLRDPRVVWLSPRAGPASPAGLGSECQEGLQD